MFDLVECFLIYGIDIDNNEIEKYFELGNKKIFFLLINNGIRLDKKIDLLSKAIKGGNLDIIEYLLKHKYKIKYKHFEFCCEIGKNDLFKLLINYDNNFIIDKKWIYYLKL